MKQDGNGATSPRRSPAGDMSTTIRAPLVAADCGQRSSAGRGLCVRTTARRAPAPYVGEASHPSTTEATRARRNRPSVQPSIASSSADARRKTIARRKKENEDHVSPARSIRYGHIQPGNRGGTEGEGCPAPRSSPDTSRRSHHLWRSAGHQSWSWPRRRFRAPARPAGPSKGTTSTTTGKQLAPCMYCRRGCH
jgi:hypothetical protein